MRKKRDAIAGRALVIDRNYVHSVLASEVGAALSGAVACLLGCRVKQGDLLLLFFFRASPLLLSSDLHTLLNEEIGDSRYLLLLQKND